MARLANFVFLLAVCHTAMSITVEELFPDVKGNLTKVKWAHRTNSKAELDAALKSNTTMMIEADVIIGNLTTNMTAGPQPIMGHPPQTQSDLSLEDFLKTAMKAEKKKGVKLDFKSIEAFTAGQAVIKKIGNLTVPVWLNADILKGPVKAGDEPAPVNAKEFLAGAKELPGAVLSIGWTTRLEPATTQNVTDKYISQQISEMLKVLKENPTNQSVTYPVRACFAANDGEVLKTLLANSTGNKATLTIWSSEGDKVNATALSTVIKNIGVDKVYVDVPKSLWVQLDLKSSAFSAQSSLSVVIASIIALVSVKFL